MIELESGDAVHRFAVIQGQCPESLAAAGHVMWIYLDHYYTVN